MKQIALLLVVAAALLAGRAPAAQAQIAFPQPDFLRLPQGHGRSRPRASTRRRGGNRDGTDGSPYGFGGGEGRWAGERIWDGLWNRRFDEPDANQIGAEAVRLPRVEAAATPPAGGTLPKTGQGATCHAASTYIPRRGSPWFVPRFDRKRTLL